MEISGADISLIFFTAFVAFVFLYKRFSKQPDAITSKYETEYELLGRPANTLSLIKDALKSAGFKKVGVDEDEKRVFAESKFSMSSWYEYIEVQTLTDGDIRKLKFKSICALPTQIYDWGKNKRNFKKFEKELVKLISSEKPSDNIVRRA